MSARRRTRLTTLAGVLALAMVVAIGSAVQADRDETGVVAGGPSGAVDTYALGVGPSDAKVVVDIYEDFLCPFCGQLETASRPLDAYYAGQSVQFRYHVIAFLDRSSTSEYSSRAANALAVVLDTSGPEVAKTFHDLLYEDQPEEGTAGLSDAELVQKAVDAGATEDDVSGAIRGRAFRQWVTNGTDAASRDGVTSTPTIMVNGKELPPAAAADAVKALQQAIEKGLA